MAALLLLPNPSSLPCDSHPFYPNSTSNDGDDGIGLGRCDSYIIDEEKRDENSSKVNTNNDIEYDDTGCVGRATDQVDERENNLSTRRVSYFQGSTSLGTPQQHESF
jgi:hypothetical protein